VRKGEPEGSKRSGFFSPLILSKKGSFCDSSVRKLTNPGAHPKPIRQIAESAVVRLSAESSI
jgi:hypothetical protein